MVEILIRFKAILPHQVLHVKCFGRSKYSTWKHMKTERPLKGHMSIILQKPRDRIHIRRIQTSNSQQRLSTDDSWLRTYSGTVVQLLALGPGTHKQVSLIKGDPADASPAKPSLWEFTDPQLTEK